jgi:hypothetical protein
MPSLFHRSESLTMSEKNEIRLPQKPGALPVDAQPEHAEHDIVEVRVQGSSSRMETIIVFAAIVLISLATAGLVRARVAWSDAGQSRTTVSQILPMAAEAAVQALSSAIPTIVDMKRANSVWPDMDALRQEYVNPFDTGGGEYTWGLLTYSTGASYIGTPSTPNAPYLALVFDDKGANTIYYSSKPPAPGTKTFSATGWKQISLEK